MSSEAPDIFKFLLGEAEYDGKWYGAIYDGVKPFWWRNPLRAAIAERDAEIARLRYYVGECLRLQEELAAERQRARLPEELVERIRAAVEHDEQFDGYLMTRILEDVLAAVEKKP